MTSFAHCLSPLLQPTMDERGEAEVEREGLGWKVLVKDLDLQKIKGVLITHLAGF